MLGKDSKIYVAGHKGLVGSAIWNNLLSRGYTNLVGRSHKELDLTDQVAVRRFFDEEQPDAVVLAAAFVGGIMANSLYRADFIMMNMKIQCNVISEAYAHGVKKLLFLGSTCIYPKLAPQPMKEDALLTSPLEYTNEEYAIAKIAGLKMCESYNLQYGTNYIAVMPTNLYGPNDNFHLENSHVLPAMMRKIYLAKLIHDNDWESIIKDLNKRPLEGVKVQSSSHSEAAEPSAKSIVQSQNNPYNPSNPCSKNNDNPFNPSNPCSKNNNPCSSIKENVLRVLAKFGIFDNKVLLWGSGKPLREFLWSEDMADACVHLLLNVNFSDIIGIEKYSSVFYGTSTKGIVDRNVSEGRGGAIPSLGEIRNCHINVGTGKEISIRELAELVARTVGFDGTIEFDASKPDGTPRKLTDVSKLHSLGWQHQVEIEEGVQRLFDWYRTSLEL
ncbi:MAG: GDP-L-fucose synthase [Prevotella sp.]|nr:GDP-L-fucose synthase [Prevotella sp.]